MADFAMFAVSTLLSALAPSSGKVLGTYGRIPDSFSISVNWEFLVALVPILRTKKLLFGNTFSTFKGPINQKSV